jgi:hypothetical protein
MHFTFGLGGINLVLVSAIICAASWPLADVGKRGDGATGMSPLRQLPTLVAEAPE